MTRKKAVRTRQFRQIRNQLFELLGDDMLMGNGPKAELARDTKSFLSRFAAELHLGSI